jgi:coenzyme F420-0:L-glutamate ligase/coenzyme F420-1:gamma-L-glutamate ligase
MVSTEQGAESAPRLALIALPGIPLIRPGDALAPLIVTAAARAEIALQRDDVLIVTSKIVSKSEGRYVDLRTVTASPRAEEIAAQTGKDARLVEVALGEAAEVSRLARNVFITRHKLGFISANAGIDHSNVGDDGEEWVLLLPTDPDASARGLRADLTALLGTAPAVVISDTHGRPHRLGNIGVAVGAAGLPALLDLRGRPDLFGRRLQYTEIALADEIAAAADLLSGQAAEGLPVTVLRGLRLPSGVPDDGRAADLYRPPALDLYR